MEIYLWKLDIVLSGFFGIIKLDDQKKYGFIGGTRYEAVTN